MHPSYRRDLRLCRTGSRRHTPVAMNGQRILIGSAYGTLEVVLLAGCGGSATVPATAATDPTSTTTPAAGFQTAVWPTPAGTTRYATPVAAVMGFAIQYLHMNGPTTGSFRQGDSRLGEVPVQPSSRGPITTVLVRQLDSGGTWWVLGAATPGITLAAPTWNTAISSPLTVAGMSTAFEGTVQVQVRADAAAMPVGTGLVTGGSTSMGPFRGSVVFTRPVVGSGAVVLYTTSAEDGSVREASVVWVRFG